MKNIMKIMLALLTSVSLVSNASAGELTVTGTAKATYNMISGGSNGALAGTGKSIGITNEIDFGATGELDNGMSWKYQVQFDPSSAQTGLVDDTRIELTSTYGTLGIYVLEGGLDVDNAASQSVYARPTDMSLSSGIVDGPGIDGFNNVQLHSPAGLLPLDMVIKVAHAPGNQTEMNSGNGKGAGVNNPIFAGTSTNQVQVKASPIDGLALGADYYMRDGQGNTINTVVQKNEAGSVFVTYAAGAATIGVSETRVAPTILSTSATATAIGNASAAGGNAAAARVYKNRKMSAAYNVNDALSVSYEIEKSNRELITQVEEFDIKAHAVQAAYTMGGMTLSLSHGETDNVNYTQNNDSNQTLIAMALAF